MPFENALPLTFALSVLYVVLRFIIFEFLYFVLRRGQCTRNWCRIQNQAGRLTRDIRSSTLFSGALSRAADGLEWVTGRGWLRGITFIFTAGILILLTTIPIDRTVEAKAHYDSSYAAVRDLNVETTALGLCIVENGLAVVKSRAGVELVRPFQLYPVDSRTPERLSQVTAEMDKAIFFLNALMDGRVLTDKRGIPPDSEGLRRLWIANTHGNKLVRNGYLFLPRSRESEAAANDIRAICDLDVKTVSVILQPVREPARYVGMIKRLQVRAAAFLSNRAVRSAHDFFQVHISASHLGLSFFFAIGAATFLWVSAKFTIIVCRWPRRGFGLFLNYILIIAASISALLFTMSGMIISRDVMNKIVPLAIGGVLVAAPGDGLEEDYRRHANVIIGKTLEFVEPTCAEIGLRSPISGVCAHVKALAEPWDSLTKSFDFARIVPETLDPGTGDVSENALIKAVAGSIVTFSVLQAGIDTEGQENSKISLWSGVRTNTFLILACLPLLFLLSLSTILVPFLDLRWAIVKRVGRIAEYYEK